MTQNFSFSHYLYRDGIEDKEHEVNITVDAKLYPGCEAVMYLPNGDPGHPAEDDEYEISKVTDSKTGVDVTADLTEKQMEDLLELAAEKAGPALEHDDDPPEREPHED